jgi:hypothetical protein
MKIDKRTLSIILMVGGILLAVASLLVDVVGLGEFPTVFGWKQILGLVVGVAAVIAGIVLFLQVRTGTNKDEGPE